MKWWNQNWKFGIWLFSNESFFLPIVSLFHSLFICCRCLSFLFWTQHFHSSIRTRRRATILPNPAMLFRRQSRCCRCPRVNTTVVVAEHIFVVSIISVQLVLTLTLHLHSMLTFAPPKRHLLSSSFCWNDSGAAELHLVLLFLFRLQITVEIAIKLLKMCDLFLCVFNVKKRSYILVK